MSVGKQNQFGEMFLLVNILKVKKMYVNNSTWNGEENSKRKKKIDFFVLGEGM